MNNKEVHYEGWLIKSPPTKRIWRARWRRRWFTLKQGEIPEQFCLEYYTDRNCRKLKGVIDLDQCEQVDCGLRLENRKQKFQYMFDIKTPKRTYYLAADTEADMRDWVNCICQVCHLHDTKQSNDLQDLQHSKNVGLGNSSIQQLPGTSHNAGASYSSSSNNGTADKVDVLHRDAIIEKQPKASGSSCQLQANNSDSVYVNTDYRNRETMLCDSKLDEKHLLAAAQQQPPPSPATALYLNHSALIQAQTQERLAVNSNGVVRKIPEILVLNNNNNNNNNTNNNNQAMARDLVPSPGVQPSPALSTASGPYIPISECFSGSPKFLIDANNPTTPLNNLDPKFYDTPRSHNNIGLNLTNDQSYSPKITNCISQQLSACGKQQRSHRSDSDSESVFTDDEEWTHPLPLRENVDRSTRPSDSSIENESFVLTYSQRFSKLPDDPGSARDIKEVTETITTPIQTTLDEDDNALDNFAKALKNKNNLILNFKDNDKHQRDVPQLSDTENTSPAIGPRNVNSVVEESYDIPRSHQLPYCNMAKLLEQVNNAENANPIAASTPNLMSGLETPLSSNTSIAIGSSTPSSVRTLPRPHCYTNAAPSQIEGNVFRYDFMEQADCPPVNRKLKPKLNQIDNSINISMEDKPPEEYPAKPPTTVIMSNTIENLAQKLNSTNLQTMQEDTVASTAVPVLSPPSVDRKCKPFGYKAGSSATLASAMRRSTGAQISMMLSHENGANATPNNFYIMETRTLPRQQRPNAGQAPNSPGLKVQHQRTVSEATAIPDNTSTIATAATAATTSSSSLQLPLPPKQGGNSEHKLQYFDLDVANKPQLNRQSISVGNLNIAAGFSGARTALATETPIQSSVVYNFVDFVKTEAFKRIREERHKESECVSNTIAK